jgi:hypothetical protein
MFNDANGEQFVAFAKLEPFLAPYREMIGNPRAFAQLEQLVMRTPGAAQRLAAVRERFRAMAARRG